MSTATKSPSTELARLEAERDRLHQAAREARAERDGHDAETAALRAELTQHRNEHPEDYFGGDFRPKPGTRAGELDAAIKQRITAPNPAAAGYDEAVGRFHEAAAAVDSFRRERFDDLLGEFDPDLDAAEEQIRQGLELLIDGSAKYAAAVAGIRELIIATPGLNGQHLSRDPRPDEWDRLARAALDSEIARPGLTAVGRDKLERQR